MRKGALAFRQLRQRDKVHHRAHSLPVIADLGNGRRASRFLRRFPFENLDQCAVGGDARAGRDGAGGRPLRRRPCGVARRAGRYRSGQAGGVAFLAACLVFVAALVRESRTPK